MLLKQQSVEALQEFLDSQCLVKVKQIEARKAEMSLAYSNRKPPAFASTLQELKPVDKEFVMPDALGKPPTFVSTLQELKPVDKELVTPDILEFPEPSYAAPLTSSGRKGGATSSCVWAEYAEHLRLL